MSWVDVTAATYWTSRIDAGPYVDYTLTGGVWTTQSGNQAGIACRLIATSALVALAATATGLRITGRCPFNDANCLAGRGFAFGYQASNSAQISDYLGDSCAVVGDLFTGEVASYVPLTLTGDTSMIGALYAGGFGYQYPYDITKIELQTPDPPSVFWQDFVGCNDL